MRHRPWNASNCVLPRSRQRRHRTGSVPSCPLLLRAAPVASSVSVNFAVLNSASGPKANLAVRTQLGRVPLRISQDHDHSTTLDRPPSDLLGGPATATRESTRATREASATRTALSASRLWARQRAVAMFHVKQLDESPRGGSALVETEACGRRAGPHPQAGLGSPAADSRPTAQRDGTLTLIPSRATAREPMHQDSRRLGCRQRPSLTARPSRSCGERKT